MEALQIALANGDMTQADKLRSYFDKVFKAEDSGEDYPCQLEHVWKVGYATKGGAVKALRKNYTEGVDFEVIIQVDKNPLGGRPEETYKLSVSCLEHFVVRVNRAVFDVYRACRQAVRRLVMPSYPEALRLLAEKVESEQQLVKQLAEAQPAVDTIQALTDSGECITMSELAKTLAIPELGLINLYKLLRKERVIQPLPSTEPYQRHVSEGHFKRIQTPYLKDGAQKMSGKTVVTPHGVTYIINLLRRRGLLPEKGA